MLSRNRLLGTLTGSHRLFGRLKEMYGVGALRLSSTFKSDVSLEKLYPNSNSDYLRPREDRKVPITNETASSFSGHIPVEQLEISHSKSCGPGGQNVNKVNSKVDLRFHLGSASWIPEGIKQRLSDQEQNRINKDGFLIVKSDMTRKQMLNQADCLNKLRNMIYKASIVPKELSEEDIAKREKRIMKAKSEALREKKRKSLLKRSRSNPEL